MDFKISFYLDERRENKNGTFPLKLRVYSSIEKKSLLFSIGYDFTKEEYIKLISSKTPKNLIEKKIALDTINAKAYSVAQKLSPFRFEDFKQNFYSKPKDSCNIIDEYKLKISNLTKLKQIKTAQSYSTSLKSICKFINPKNPDSVTTLHVINITVDWLKNYENHMLKENKTYSTIGIYLRCLRCIVNTIISENTDFKKHYPFGTGKLYQIPASSKVKKALSTEDIKKIYNSTPANQYQEHAKDFWMLSYFCNGMNMSDILRLKFRDIDTNHMKLSFYRNKTFTSTRQQLKKIEIILNEKIITIIDKYKNEDSNENNYVFPYLSPTDTEITIVNKIDKFIRKINQHLKNYAKSIGITEEISTYWARHSFSTIAVNNGASIELISESLGHTDIKTTKVYLDGFDEENKTNLSKIISDFL